MAYSIVWPPTLPQEPIRDGYGEQGGVQRLKTPMDKGPAKLRKQFVKPDTLSLAFMMSKEQLLSFETFLKETTGGIKRFGFMHPRKREMVEVRFLNDDYSMAPLAPNLWRVAFDVEVLP